MNHSGLKICRLTVLTLSLVVAVCFFNNALATQGPCESLNRFSPKRSRIYNPVNYTALDPHYQMALSRFIEKGTAQKNILAILNVGQLIALQASFTIEIAGAPHSSLTSHPPPPILSGVKRALDFAQNPKTVSSLSNDDLILFLSQVYELQHNVQIHPSLTWVRDDQDQIFKMEITDLLTELKMHLWRQMTNRGITALFLKSRIQDFFDLELVIPPTPESEKLQQNQNEILELLDMDIKIFHRE